jgi:putative peptidoglycan lipid II flippase
MDAYVAAFFIPNLLYLILITGALSPIFMTLFLEYRSKDLNEGVKVLNLVANFSAIGLVALVGITSLTARSWLAILFAGFSGPQLALTLHLYYIIAPGIVFVGLAGILAAALNGLEHFAFPAIAPIAYSVAVIFALWFWRGPQAIQWAAVATTVGLAAQLFVQLPIAARLGLRYQFTFDYRHPALKRILRLGVPLLLYLLVAHGSVLLERNLASRASIGAVSGFNYATRLFAIPCNLLAAPLALVSFPEFSREAAKSKRGMLVPKLLSSLRLTIFLFLPITIWMFLQALPLTRLMLERGQFNITDSRITAGVLSIYSLGILPNALAVILLRGFYAIQDTITPLWVETLNLAFYVLAAPYLAARYGLHGLAIARAISFLLVGCILLFVLNRRLRIVTPLLPQGQFMLKLIGASILMGAVSWASFRLLRRLFDAHGFWLRSSIVIFLMLASAGVYLALCEMWAIPEVRSITRIPAGFFMRFPLASWMNSGEGTA